MKGSMEKAKLRTAIVGAGKMGNIHAKVYHQLDESELVAIVDADLKKASKLAKKYKCDAYADCNTRDHQNDATIS